MEVRCVDEDVGEVGDGDGVIRVLEGKRQLLLSRFGDNPALLELLRELKAYPRLALQVFAFFPLRTFDVSFVFSDTGVGSSEFSDGFVSIPRNSRCCQILSVSIDLRVYDYTLFILVSALVGLDSNLVVVLITA